MTHLTEPKRYRTIVVDPPWAYDRGFLTGPGEWGRSAGADGKAYAARALPYPSMSLDDIKALPLDRLVDPAGTNVFLWTTNRYLCDGFKVLEAWGCKFSQIVVWAKPPGSQPPTPRFALAPNSAEFILFGRYRGGCKLGDPLGSSVVTVPRAGAHSTKPEVFLDLIEQVSPGPHLEMFARRDRLGWDTWGNESLGTAEVAA